jgi:hypothetical protein
MVVFDAGFLLMLMDPSIQQIPRDPVTGESIEDGAKRVEFLVNTLSKEKQKIIVPTPALSEVLVRANEARNACMEYLRKSKMIRVEPFCQLAAYEVALMTKKAIDRGDKKEGLTDTWNKVKYDRQILAIALVHGATALYTWDNSLINLANNAGMKAVSIGSLPLPPHQQVPIDMK